MDALGVIPWTARAKTWTFTHIGRGVESLLGYPERDWRKSGFWLAHVDGADRDALLDSLHDAMTCPQRSAVVCVYRFANAAGEMRWLRSAIRRRARVRDSLAGVHIDVTAERRASSPRFDEDLYRYALSTAGVVMWEAGADERDGWVNPVLSALIGFASGHRLRQREWLQRVHPRDRALVAEHASDACSPAVRPPGGNVTPLSRAEYRIRHADGSMRWLATTVAMVPSHDGSAPRVFGTGADITERMRERSALREAERLYHDVWQSLPGSAAVLDRAGVIVQVNHAWEAVTRVGAGAPGCYLGKNYLTEVRAAAARGDATAAGVADGLALVLRGAGEQFTADYSCRVDDVERWFRLRILPLHRAARGAIVIHDDITERMAAEWATQQLRNDLTHMQRLATLGELATSIAHELNQPLAAIMASASTARRVLRDNHDIAMLRPVVNDILESAARAADVVRRARVMVRHDASTLEKVSINDVVSAVARLLASDLVIHQVALETELDRRVRPVVGDSVQLQQVLLNLLLNAVDALRGMPRDRRMITVTTRHVEPNTVELRVGDTGPGIRPDLVDRVFEPFITTKHKGTGLGLAIVRAIVHAHGGEVFAESPAEGGAAFRVVLSVP